MTYNVFGGTLDPAQPNPTRAPIVAMWADRFSRHCWRRFSRFLTCPLTLHPVPVYYIIQVRRTVKFLCGVARGLLIVTPDWLDKCKSAGKFIGQCHLFYHCDE